MKKAIYGLLALMVVAIIAAVIALPKLVSVDNIKQHAYDQVEKITGRKLDIRGNVSVAFWPTVSVVLDDVHFSNAEWSQHKEMASVKELALELAWMPLLTGELQVNRFVLNQPVILLEMSSKGQANWEFADIGRMRGEAQFADTETQKNDAAGMGSIKSLKLGDVKIKEGKLAYYDDRGGKKYELSDIDMSLAMKDINSAIKLTLDTKYKNQPFDIKLQTGAISDLLGKGETDATLDVSSQVLDISFTGMMNKKGKEAYADGKLSISTKDLRTLAALMDAKISSQNGVLQKASLNGKVKISDSMAELDQALISLDEISGSGTLDVNYGGAVPKIKADISFDNMDISPYMNSAAKTAAIWGISEAYADTPHGWDSSPVDFGWLKSLNLDAKIKASSFKANKFVAEKIDASAAINNGVMNMKLPSAKLYGGDGNIELAVQHSEGGASIRSKGSVSGINLGDALAALGSNFMTGTGGAEWNLACSGNSQQRWVETMQGSMSAQSKNGTISGFNMLDMAKNVTAALTGQQQDTTTKYNSLKAVFDGAAGVFTSKELAMDGPGFSATGEGKVMLPPQQIDFKLHPTIAAAANAKQASSMTIHVEGSWYAPKFKTDLKATIKNALQDPDSAKKSLQDLRKNLKGLLGGK